MRDRRSFLAGLSTAGTALVAGCGGAGGENTDEPDRKTITSGIRVRAPLVGLHVSDLDIQEAEPLAGEVAAELGVDQLDVQVRPQRQTIEVFNEGVDPAELASALQTAGLEAGSEDATSGVTDATRETVVEVLKGRIDRMDASGGRVSTTDERLVVVGIPDTTPERARDIVTDRGQVRIVAEVTDPETGETTNTTVLTGGDISRFDSAQQRQPADSWEVPVTVRDESADRFQGQLVELGFTSDDGVGNCDRTSDRDGPSGSYCLLTTLDGDLIRSNGMGDSLARGLDEGTWTERPTFTIGAPNESQAEAVHRSLKIGSLPTSLDLDAPSAEVTQVGE